MRPQQRLVRTALIRYTGGLAFTLLGLALILIPGASSVQAHGGGVPQLTNAEAGPYQVSVWTEPDPIRAGKLHVTVAVSEPQAPGANAQEVSQLVLDAIVRVQVEPLDRRGETLTATATRDNAVNKLFYEADLDLPAEGQWQVVIGVEGPAGSGQTGFEITALPPSAFSSLLGRGWPLWAGLGMVLLAAGWWFQMSRVSKTEVSHA